MKKLILPIGLAAFLIAACGKKDEPPAPATQTTPPAATAPTQPGAPATSDPAPAQTEQPASTTEQPQQ